MNSLNHSQSKCKCMLLRLQKAATMSLGQNSLNQARNLVVKPDLVKFQEIWHHMGGDGISEVYKLCYTQVTEKVIFDKKYKKYF